MNTSLVISKRGSAKKGERASAALENASLAINAAMELAPAIPVPILSSILQSVKVIVDAAKVC